MMKSAPIVALYPVVNRPEMYYNRGEAGDIRVTGRFSRRDLGTHLTAEAGFPYARRTDDDQLNGAHSLFMEYDPYRSHWEEGRKLFDFFPTTGTLCLRNGDELI